MKMLKLLSAAVLALAAAGAYAGSDDGNVNGEGNPGIQQSGSQQTPPPAPSASNDHAPAYDSSIVSPLP
ncbi:MAG TPA: hypothetical protein VGN52_17700 [Burkholderiales bacterium]